MQLFTRNPNGVILNANLRAYDLKPGMLSDSSLKTLPGGCRLQFRRKGMAC